MRLLHRRRHRNKNYNNSKIRTNTTLTVLPVTLLTQFLLYNGNPDLA
jgi:hypothetical protein